MRKGAEAALGHIKNIHLHRCKHKNVKLKLTLTLTLTLTDTGGAVLTLMLGYRRPRNYKLKRKNTNLRLREYERCIFLILPAAPYGGQGASAPCSNSAPSGPPGGGPHKPTCTFICGDGWKKWPLHCPSPSLQILELLLGFRAIV